VYFQVMLGKPRPDLLHYQDEQLRERTEQAKRAQ
jgi:hypothetical protein